ncbi:hypothetical protein BKA70DRAFT_1539011 [Coprinopsis sp. MPI-PUGE-AT-0042]|nr:hypothetical protein BKA70DRAFT_1539011 [Coprinopsis sp. MPI-PUGE-AT-0042]
MAFLVFRGGIGIGDRSSLARIAADLNLSVGDVVNEEPSVIATDSQQTQMMNAHRLGVMQPRLEVESASNSRKGGFMVATLYEALYDDVIPERIGFGSNIRPRDHCLGPTNTSLGTIESFVKPAFTKRLGFSVGGEAFLDEEDEAHVQVLLLQLKLASQLVELVERVAQEMPTKLQVASPGRLSPMAPLGLATAEVTRASFWKAVVVKDECSSA